MWKLLSFFTLSLSLSLCLSQFVGAAVFVQPKYVNNLFTAPNEMDDLKVFFLVVIYNFSVVWLMLLNELVSVFFLFRCIDKRRTEIKCIASACVRAFRLVNCLSSSAKCNNNDNDSNKMKFIVFDVNEDEVVLFQRIWSRIIPRIKISKFINAIAYMQHNVIIIHRPCRWRRSKRIKKKKKNNKQ